MTLRLSPTCGLLDRIDLSPDERTIKLMAQPLSLASIPVRSTRPCCGTLHWVKAFLWPTALFVVFSSLASFSSFICALCLILSPGCARFPKFSTRQKR